MALPWVLGFSFPAGFGWQAKVVVGLIAYEIKSTSAADHYPEIKMAIQQAAHQAGAQTTPAQGFRDRNVEQADKAALPNRQTDCRNVRLPFPSQRRKGGFARNNAAAGGILQCAAHDR